MSGKGKRRIKVSWRSDGFSGVAHAYERDASGYKPQALCGQNQPVPYYVSDSTIHCSPCAITLKQRW